MIKTIILVIIISVSSTLLSNSEETNSTSFAQQKQSYRKIETKHLSILTVNSKVRQACLSATDSPHNELARHCKALNTRFYCMNIYKNRSSEIDRTNKALNDYCHQIKPKIPNDSWFFHHHMIGVAKEINLNAEEIENEYDLLYSALYSFDKKSKK
ncbi:MAG: hypothetical protein WC707_02430 [Candidatus Babeliaceae bacterium]|jgi:hypothetical protein